MPRLCHVTFKLHSHRPPASAVGAAIRNHFGLLDGFLTETCPPFGGISPASLESGLLKSPGSGRQMMALVPRLCDWLTRSSFCWILMNLNVASKTHPHLGHPWQTLPNESWIYFCSWHRTKVVLDNGTRAGTWALKNWIDGPTSVSCTAKNFSCTIFVPVPSRIYRPYGQWPNGRYSMISGTHSGIQWSLQSSCPGCSSKWAFCTVWRLLLPKFIEAGVRGFLKWSTLIRLQDFVHNCSPSDCSHVPPCARWQTANLYPGHAWAGSHVKSWGQQLLLNSVICKVSRRLRTHTDLLSWP